MFRHCHAMALPSRGWPSTKNRRTRKMTSLGSRFPVCRTRRFRCSRSVVGVRADFIGERASEWNGDKPRIAKERALSGGFIGERASCPSGVAHWDNGRLARWGWSRWDNGRLARRGWLHWDNGRLARWGVLAEGASAALVSANGQDARSPRFCGANGARSPMNPPDCHSSPRKGGILSPETIAKPGRDGVPPPSAAGDGTPTLPFPQVFAIASIVYRGERCWEWTAPCWPTTF